MTGVYKFTNTITGMSYIGQSKNIKKRYSAHKNHYNKKNKKTGRYEENSFLHQMMRKYGFENFTFEILEECAEDELLDKEIYYISKYNTIYPYGYNFSAGGKNPHFMKLNAKIIENIYSDLNDDKLTVNVFRVK